MPPPDRETFELQVGLVGLVCCSCSSSGWWFQDRLFDMFTPKIGEMIPNSKLFFFSDGLVQRPSS